MCTLLVRTPHVVHARWTGTSSVHMHGPALKVMSAQQIHPMPTATATEMTTATATAMPSATATPMTTTTTMPVATATAMPISASKPTAPIGVPLSETMERVLGPLDVVSVEQTPRGCIQECLGCSARSEFILYGGYREGRMSHNIFSGVGGPPAGDSFGQIGHMLEESPFFPDRCFWSGMRKLQIPIRVPDQNGEEMMSLTKDFSLPTHCIVHGDNGDLIIPMCCCLPAMKTLAPDGTVAGKAQYVCDQYLFVPKIKTYDADGNKQYLVRPDTCCAGCCPVCECGSGGGN